MVKDDLKCMLIGRDIDIYTDLARLVRKLDSTSRFKQVDLKKSAITAILKKINGPSLIFISDEVPYSLESLSDLAWQYNSDAIIVIVTTKAPTVSLKKRFNNTLFSRLNLNKNNTDKASTLNFLIQSSREKYDFRRCKSLLGISEKRCQWLVDSSREAIAYISRDVHWYANSTYLELLGVSSVQELRSITIKDVIVPDEHLLFDGFQRNEMKSSEKRNSLTLSIKKVNGSVFRANIYLIPSVFKGQKCFQLWIKKINKLPNSNDVEDLIENSASQTKTVFVESEKSKQSSREKKNIEREDNPFSTLLNKDNPREDLTKTNSNKFEQVLKTNDSDTNESFEKSNVTKNSYSYNSLLKGVIRRKEAKLVSTPLNPLKIRKTSNNTKSLNHLMVSLKVAAAQKRGIDDLLLELPEGFDKQMRTVFWEKVKFSRIIRILIKKKQLSVSLLLPISEAAVSDKDFIDWLIPGLNRLGHKSKNIIFLIPSNIQEKQYKQTLALIKKLRLLKCQVALDSFFINKKSLVFLKYSKPEYVRLSLPWTRQIQGDELKEIRLSGFIRKLESLKIKVIAPCAYSKDMRKLFILSGASFCQERVIKTA